MSGDEVLNIRGVDSATAAMVRRLAAFRGATYAELLTLMAGEYAQRHEGELMAWARGDAK